MNAEAENYSPQIFGKWATITKYVRRTLEQFAIKTSVFSQRILFIPDADCCGGGGLEAGFWKQRAALPLAQSNFSALASALCFKNIGTFLDTEI